MSQFKNTLLENQILAINNNSHNKKLLTIYILVYTHTHKNLRILAYLQMILGFFIHIYFMLNNGTYIYTCNHFETDYDIRQSWNIVLGI